MPSTQDRTPLIERYPPLAGEPVLVDDRFPPWRTYVWVSREALCVMTARSLDHQRPGQASGHTSCDRLPEELRTEGPPALVSQAVSSKPLPQLPVGSDSAEIMLIGQVRGPAATVEVTMFGVTATGHVRPLPTGDARHIGAYAVWLPASGSGRDGMNLSDITAVVARDDTGRILDTIP